MSYLDFGEREQKENIAHRKKFIYKGKIKKKINKNDFI